MTLACPWYERRRRCATVVFRPAGRPERENIENLWRFARENDLRAAEVITDAKGDRARRAHQQDDPDLYLRIVDRSSKDGIVVRGAKLHITAASLVHELVVMPTKSMRHEEADYAVSFSIPDERARCEESSTAASRRPSCRSIRLPRERAPHDAGRLRDLRRRVRAVGARVPRRRGPARRACSRSSLGLWERTLGMVEAASA